MKTVRYHIQLDSHRTTVSLDKVISDLLAIKLEKRPGSKQAHIAIRSQLEKFIAHDKGRAGYRLGRYINEQALLLISDKILSSRYLEIKLEEYESCDIQ